MKPTSIVLVAFAFCGCGAAPSPEPKASEPPPSPAASSAPAAAPTVAAHALDAPEISRSTGTAGGVVVLWPRIVGDKGGPLEGDTRQIAARIQRRLQSIVGRALPGRSVDVRPEPERVCPRAGCQAIAVGAVLSRSGGGCA